MKGKASIILADADSGRAIKRLEEKNIITNAAKNVFNLPLEYRINEINHSAIFNSCLPIWKSLMGGIVLLDNNIAEDADNIFLPPEAKIVATAGAAYSGASPYIGSLNLNESCEISGGYRLTWDFATDKANGTIKCVCLTSRQFGSSGAVVPETTNGVAVANPTTINLANTSPSGVTMFSGKGQYVYSKSATKHIFFTGASDSRLIFTEQSGVDPKNLLINDTAGYNVLCRQTAEHIVQVPFAFTGDYKFFFDPEKKYLYFFGDRAYDIVSDATQTEYIAVDLASYTIAEHKQITLSGNVRFTHAAVYFDSLFLANNQVLCRYSLDGALLREYDSNVADSGFFALGGCLYTYIDNYLLYMVTPEHACKLSRTSGNNISAASFLKPPLVATAIRSNHAVSSAVPTTPVYAQILNAYMASINNLSQPIEKTSAQTLKIIYEITN